MAFPAISTGVYHFPVDRATAIALRETAAFLNSDNQMEKIHFVCFSDSIYITYRQCLQDILQ
jgi:O-acetyl-ADP-ribose deacetylase (regulator of RNase III)